MADRIDFNRAKFKELVLYLAQRSARAGDEGFGMVKLNKLLYRADFEAFRLLGRPITGETYERQDYGPVARDLPLVLDELGAQGRLHWHRIPTGPHTRKVPGVSGDPTSGPDPSVFSSHELQVIEQTLRELSTHGGKSASDWSHEESAGWNAVEENGRVIEYYTAVVSTRPIPPQNLEWARQYALDRGWFKNTA